MKLGLLAALTGIAIAVGLSKKKDTRPVPSRASNTRPPTGTTRVTGTAPQEGVDAQPAPVP
jgi:hypothetical protein